MSPPIHLDHNATTPVAPEVADAPAFRHLENFDSLHRANMNRAFTEFEAQ